MVLVPFPLDAAPTAPGTAASGPVWHVTVTARYRPADQVAAPGADPGDPPLFQSIAAQAPALVDDGGVFVPNLARDATTGGPLVLASLAPPAPQTLVVRPAP